MNGVISVEVSSDMNEAEADQAETTKYSETFEDLNAAITRVFEVYMRLHRAS